MEPNIFLTSSDQGIARAERDPNGDWQVEHLLTGEQMTCLANDPSNPRRMFAGTRTGRVHHSLDGGQTWSPSGTIAGPVKSIAISPHDPNVLFAGTKPALMFKSTDGGESWRELEGFRRIPNRWWWFSPAEPPDRRPYVLSIAPSPTEKDVVLAGVEFGAVVRSADGGETWSRHRTGALRDSHSLKFHATHGDWVYQAGGTGGGASFSRDGGQTFRKAKKGLAKNYGIVCAADPEKPEIWYVCVAPSPFKAFGDNPQIYLYRSSGGAGWQPIGWQAHPLPATPTTLVTLADAPGHLYAGLNTGIVMHSPDYGNTWERMPFNLGGIWTSLVVI